ncbi:uncharacterized protein B0H64DRAFT_158869 [Chaetomium fimeti]|uniref:Uncharacterized protein n=1 Tax=Chaetomium fimeti TaxID=1854472 RepID=A0AAE0LSJ0_9PEZI|nr:hypothetical protein B0H64DRAFT_158869 [Chaetomium fimeti]
MTIYPILASLVPSGYLVGLPRAASGLEPQLSLTSSFCPGQLGYLAWRPERSGMGAASTRSSTSRFHAVPRCAGPRKFGQAAAPVPAPQLGASSGAFEVGASEPSDFAGIGDWSLSRSSQSSRMAPNVTGSRKWRSGRTPLLTQSSTRTNPNPGG